LLYKIYQIEYLHDATDDDYDPLRDVANSLGLDIKKFYPESANESERGATADDVVLPDFEIVDEEIYDVPIKTQVIQHIVVSGNITEENIKALLLRQCDAIMERRGFKHHVTPTMVGIFAYETEEQAKSGAGLWLAMLKMGPLEKGKPRVEVRSEQIANIGKEPEE